MEINGLALTVINEDKLIWTQIINASQTMKAAFFVCVCVSVLDEKNERYLGKCLPFILEPSILNDIKFKLFKFTLVEVTTNFIVHL